MWSQRSKILRILLFLAVIVPVMGVAKSRTPSVFSKQKVIIQTYANQVHSTQDSAFDLAAAQHPALAADAQVLSANTQLVALVDNSCVQSKRHRVTSAQLSTEISTREFYFGRPHRQLDVQAYEFSLSQAQSIAKLKMQADRDECLIGITENAMFYSQALPENLNDDPRFPEQIHLTNLSVQDGHNTFWRSALGIKKTAVIAIVDSGVNYLHPDLVGRMWRGGDGKFGFDFVNNDSDPMDDNHHGTHCAGLAAAESSNQIGVSGVMGFNAQIMAVKTLNDAGAGSLTNLVNGIRFAIQNGANIINLSLSGKTTANAALEQALRDAVAAGIVVLAAAGNDNVEISNANFYQPAGFASAISGMLSIGSYDVISGNRSAFSNFSTSMVELGSPGSASGQAGLLSTSLGSSYEFLQGTSMATPITAGAVALALAYLKSNDLNPTAAEMEEILANAAIQDQKLVNAFRDGRRLNINNLGLYLRQSYVLQGTGGFDD